MKISFIADALADCVRMLRMGVEHATDDDHYAAGVYWRAHDALIDLEAHIDPVWLADNARTVKRPGMVAGSLTMDRADRIISALVMLRATDPVRAKAVLDALQGLGDALTPEEVTHVVRRISEID